MEITEAKELKEKLSFDICNLIAEYERKTDCCVSDIRLEHITHESGESYIYNINIGVSL